MNGRRDVNGEDDVVCWLYWRNLRLENTIKVDFTQGYYLG